MLWNGIEWNGNKISVWNGIEDFIIAMERVSHTFINFSYLLFLMCFIPNINNKAAFDKTHRMIKEKSSSQRSIPGMSNQRPVGCPVACFMLLCGLLLTQFFQSYFYCSIEFDVTVMYRKTK